MSASKKKAPVLTLSSDSEDAQPATKPSRSTPSSSSKKKAATPVKKATKKEAETDSDYEMHDVNPSASTSAGSKKRPLKKDTSSEEDEEHTNGKGKGKAKAKVEQPSKKRVKKDDDDEDEKPEVKPKPKWSFKPREGPVAPGSKEIPAGAENCLAGLTFVLTGEMESISREEGQALIKRYGGRVTSAPSSKTSYVVVGKDAGPKKLEMIKKHKLKTLSEDGLLELIGQRPSGASDPAYREQQKKEQEKVVQVAKQLGPKKDDPAAKNKLWTVKYAPTKLTEVCGNKSNVEKLSKWLESWPKSLACGFKKPGPDAMNVFRAILISGPPGIGKTTAAHLVAKQHGYDVLELNASDVRSKKLLETAFKSKITDTTISGFFKSDTNSGDNLGINKKSLIIMDEVDGMSAGDRGGVGALNALIRKTKVPIIAICNDSKSPKMKPLAATCFSMTFRRPTAAEIRSRMMSIAFKEGLKVQGNAIDQLIEGSQSDIRQVVNMLSTWKLGQTAMDFDQGKKLAGMNKKNTIETPWTLYSKLFAPSAFGSTSSTSLNDKLDVYFHDFSIMPLFVQENYMRGNLSRAAGYSGKELELKKLDLISKAADALSDGDLVDRMIHGSEQHWSLMPTHGMFSCVRPAYFCHGGGFPAFPQWLGKNSAQGKMYRLLSDVQIHMRLKTSGDRREIRQHYIPTLFQQVVTPIIEQGSEAIPSVIETMDEYYLTKEDWDSIVEMGVGDLAGEPLLKKIAAPVKSAFTRKYNAADHPVPFYKSSAGKPSMKISGGAAPDLEEAFIDEEDILSDEEVDGTSGSDADVSKDKLIKNKAKPSKKTTAGDGAAAKGATAKGAKKGKK